MRFEGIINTTVTHPPLTLKQLAGQKRFREVETCSNTFMEVMMDVLNGWTFLSLVRFTTKNSSSTGNFGITWDFLREVKCEA